MRSIMIPVRPRGQRAVRQVADIPPSYPKKGVRGMIGLQFLDGEHGRICHEVENPHVRWLLKSLIGAPT